MDFDEMLTAWRAQDEAPLYGVNRDLLQLVVRSEQADLQRTLRLETWTTYISGAVMTAAAVAVLWWFMSHRQPGAGALLGAASAGAFALWAVALGRSHRRQAQRERGFGNSLQEEVRRTLSATEYQLSMMGRWTTLTLWSAPIIIGASVLYELIAEINDNTSRLFDASMIAFIVLSTLWTNVETSRRRKRALTPRRDRLRDLLAILEPPA